MTGLQGTYTDGVEDTRAALLGDPDADERDTLGVGADDDDPIERSRRKRRNRTVLVGLPGLLWTLPRALRAPAPAVVPSVSSRRQLSERRQSFLRTDLLGVALLLLAQAPLPAPWGPAGKAATIANITKSPEIVELSAQFATYSLGVFAVGVVAAVIVKVYGHAAAYRVIGIILAVGAPVVAWFLVMRTL